MKDKDPKDYFVKMTPEFLFDTYGVFKSEYAPWVYLFLKFKYNYYLDYCPNKRFSMPTGISNLFGVNPSTITRALQELVQHGFLERNNTLYKIKDESIYINKYKPVINSTVRELYLNEERTLYPKFIKIYKEEFQRMFIRFRERIPEQYKSKKFIIKTIETYYYLTAKNKHCLLEEKMVTSFECPHSICKTLHYDNRTLKNILNVLEDAGYIKLGPEIKITTININYEDATVSYSDVTKKTNYSKTEPLSNYPIPDKHNNTEEQIEEEYYFITKHIFDEETGMGREIKQKVKGKEPVGLRNGGFVYGDVSIQSYNEFEDEYNYERAFNTNCA